ncbi:MAG: Maf family protein [Oscillospiraceae bacterium]
MKIILASGSPRRKELLEALNVKNLEIIPAKGEEKAHPELSPAELVKELSRCKAAEVAEKCGAGAVVIGADTVVSLDGEVLGKPRDEADAKRMLRALSGREHEVFTGVTLIKGDEILSHAERTAVRFRPLTEEEIEAYIRTGEPMDKAGAYGAQGYASLFVEHLDGDFFNVMGLPVCALGTMLKKMGVNLL